MSLGFFSNCFADFTMRSSIPTYAPKALRPAEGAFVLKTFCHRHVTRLLQRANVGGHITISHPQCITQFGKRKLRRSGEHGHNCHAAFLVDYFIQMLEGFRVHSSSTGLAVSFK